jgi:plastocyanin
MTMRAITRLIMAAGAAALTAIGVAACFSEHVAPEPSEIDVRGICAGTSTIPATVVIIRNFSFQPATITARLGDRLTWVNCESTAGLGHTSTSDANMWRSGLIIPFSSYSRTFDQAGSFPYHCEPHPSMKATIVVQ